MWFVVLTAWIDDIQYFPIILDWTIRLDVIQSYPVFGEDIGGDKLDT